MNVAHNIYELAVLIPVFQDAKGLARTLASLRECTFPASTIVIVVDDGSDPPLSLSDHPELPTLHLLRLPNNQGIEAALNAGMEAADKLGARYVARIDAGDMALPRRFVLQYEAMEAEPSLVLLGTAAVFSAPDGSELFRYAPPLTDDSIRGRMHINCCLLHPTVMMRMDALAALGPPGQCYSTRYPAAEDYDLFWRLIAVGQCANLPEPLVIKEVSIGSISLRRRRKQLISRLKLQIRGFNPRRATSYLGLLLTLLFLVTPNGLVIRVKKLLGRSPM